MRSPSHTHDPHTFRRRRKIVILCGVPLLVLAVAGWYLRISSPRDLFAYYAMSAETHPVWRDFALRRFSPGDPVTELIQAFPPSAQHARGPYIDYAFYTGPGDLHFSGLFVTAKNGNLVSATAGSCTWDFTFFDIEHSD